MSEVTLSSEELLQKSILTTRSTEVEKKLARARELHRDMLYAVRVGEYDTWEKLNVEYQSIIDSLWFINQGL